MLSDEFQKAFFLIRKWQKGLNTKNHLKKLLLE